MSSNKNKKFKDFVVSTRKSLRSSISAAPVWAMQKAGKRLWNSKQKRHWKNIGMKKKFNKQSEK